MDFKAFRRVGDLILDGNRHYQASMTVEGALRPRNLLKAEHALREALQVIETLKEGGTNG